MARLRSLPAVVAFALAAGCDEANAPAPIGRADSPAPEGTTSEASDTGDSSGGGSVADAGSDAGDDPRCAMVDLLFVIDNSSSMADEQASLVASFPGFIADIEELLGQASYHVGVVTTDDNEFNGPGCRRLGALTTQTGGDGSSDSICGPYHGGKRYMTAEDDLEVAFACAARVGIDGAGVERPMDAVQAVLTNDADVALCNDGFLRSAALLVLVVITDEDDDHSAADPLGWYASIAAAKNAERVVMLSLVGLPKPNSCIAEQWDGKTGAEVAHRMIQLTGSFPYGQLGDVCAASYQPFFRAAIAPIADACGIPLVPD